MVKKRMNDKRKKDLIFYVVMLAIPLLQFSIFYIGVNFNSVLLTFQKYTTDGVAGKPGYVFLDFPHLFQNFIDVFNEMKETWVAPAVKNSLISYAVSLVFATGLSLVFSFYVYKKFPLYGLTKVVLFAPSIISGTVLVSIFLNFMNEVIPGIAEKICFDILKTELPDYFNEPIIATPATSETFWWILFYCIWIGFGGSILLYLGAMNNISESVIEACKLDGANMLQELIYIVLPLIYPTFVTFIVVGVGGIFTGQMGLYAFYGLSAEEPVRTFGYQLFIMTKSASATGEGYPKLATMGLMMTALIAPLTFFVKWLLEKVGPKVE